MLPKAYRSGIQVADLHLDTGLREEAIAEQYFKSLLIACASFPIVAAISVHCAVGVAATEADLLRL